MSIVARQAGNGMPVECCLLDYLLRAWTNKASAEDSAAAAAVAEKYLPGWQELRLQIHALTTWDLALLSTGHWCSAATLQTSQLTMVCCMACVL